MSKMEGHENFEPVEKEINDGGKKNKRMEIFIVAVIAVIVIAVVVTAVIVKSKNKSNNDGITVEASGDVLDESAENYEPVSMKDEPDITFEGVSDVFVSEFEEHQIATTAIDAYKPEPVRTTVSAVQTEKQTSVSTTQYLETTTVKTDAAADSNSKVMSLIEAFFNGTYYMDGTMISAGSQSPMEMAMNGNDFQIYSELEGVDISVMNYDGKLYLMNPDNKTYIEINSALKKMMGVEDDSFTFEFNKVKFDSKSPTSVTKATYNGNSAVCYTYKDSTNCIEFIAVGDEIKQITQYSNSNAETVLQADEFSAEIPSDMLTFKGYSKANMVSFLKDLM